MPRYRKKPVEVEAIQWTGGNAAEIKAFVGTRHHGGPAFVLPEENIWKTNRACVWNSSQDDYNTVNKGDWIIRGSAGEFYPCEPGVFEATFEPVES